MPKPFESAVQDLVYHVDVGSGLQFIKKGLYALFILVVLLWYAAAEFHGFDNAEAMEYAQLGRNLATEGKLITNCIRPASIWFLSAHGPRQDARIDRHPDILHPPLYPAVLAAAFKLTRVDFTPPVDRKVFTPERIVLVVNYLFTVLTGWLVFLLGKRLFDRRVAVLGVTVFFLSDTVLGTGISGTNLAMTTFLGLAACGLALAAASSNQDGAPPSQWIPALVGSAVCCALAFLTRYGAVVLVPGLALFVGWSWKQKGWAWAGAFALVFLLSISPWLIRNKAVSGGFFGLAPYTALNETTLFEEDQFDRNVKPSFGGAGRVITALQVKSLKTFADGFNIRLRTIGDGPFIALFLAMFLHRFVRPSVHRLRWCAALSMALLLLLGGFFGSDALALLTIFWPLVILYGLAFFLVLLERLQLSLRLFSLGITSALVFLGALPLVLTLLPPRSGIPYPPYFPPYITYVCRMMDKDELLCADLPWATAWYGAQNSILLPAKLEDFYEINDYVKRISGLYFTTLTRDKPYARTLMAGAYRSWFPILEGRIPGDFPLIHGFTLPPNSPDQLFLSDRARWKQQSAP